jgi:hypothetical protein
MTESLHSATNIEYVNATMNEVTEGYGAGLMVRPCFGVSLQFCFFWGNTGLYGTLAVTDSVSGGFISCLGFFGNSCGDLGAHILTQSDVTLRRCLFQANAAASIVLAIDVSVAFVDSVFDVNAIGLRGYGVLSVTDCEFGTIADGLPGCNVGTPLATPPPANTRTSMSYGQTLPSTAYSGLPRTTSATAAGTPAATGPVSPNQSETMVAATAMVSNLFTPPWDILLRPRKIRQVWLFLYLFDDA